MNHLNLSTLEIFRQVARAGSISGAAQILNRVQSNISTRIKQVEDQLGTPLFERGKKGMTLTDSGRTLLGYAEEMLHLSDQAIEAVSDGLPSGVLKIGTMESTAASRLPEFLARYHHHFPKVEVRVRTDVAGALIEQVRSKQVDVAFVAEPVEFDDLQKQPVFEEDLVLLTTSSFSQTGIGELNGKTVIAFEEGCAYRRYLNQWLLQNGVVAEKILSIGSYLGMFACISAGTGFGVAPASVVETLAVSDRFNCQPLGGEFAKIKTVAIWRKGYESSNLSALMDLLPRL